MAQLIGNIVQTQRADYAFATREEAEAFFIQVMQRDAARPKTSPPRLKATARSPGSAAPRR